MIHIAIDGPAGAGKSTVAKELAKQLGCIYVDTGALYRAAALYIDRLGIDCGDAERVEKALPGASIRLQFRDGAQRVFLGDEDVSEKIRENRVSPLASRISAIPFVRAFLLDLQRDLAKDHAVVMDGRDIGTVVLPQAELKIFMTASPEERARRRYLELKEKGKDVVYESILAEMAERDRADATRDASPAVAAPDAILLDNSGFTVEQSVAAIRKIARERGLL